MVAVIVVLVYVSLLVFCRFLEVGINRFSSRSELKKCDQATLSKIKQHSSHQVR